MFLLKPDYQQSLNRIAAFWEGEVLDRPPVEIRIQRKDAVRRAGKKYPDENSRWRDVDNRAERMALEMENTLWLGDALPVAWPNMGPEILSAWCGCGYHFGTDTAWSDPCVRDWAADAPKARLDMEHELFKLTEKYTRNLLELGRGRFITGLTDFHPGGDHLAALRDPQALALDLLDHPDEVRKALVNARDDYFKAYEYFYGILKASGGLDYTASWMAGLGSPGRFYIPSNDFSCMISTAMFEEFFLPGIREECRYYDRCVYHLDGPGALRHLDVLLEIPELGAVQWVPGAGNEGFARWAHVYRRIQQAGKGFTLSASARELPMVFETLRPEGAYFLSVQDVSTPEEADNVLKRIEKWE